MIVEIMMLFVSCHYRMAPSGFRHRQHKHSSEVIVVATFVLTAKLHTNRFHSRVLCHKLGNRAFPSLACLAITRDYPSTAKFGS